MSDMDENKFRNDVIEGIEWCVLFLFIIMCGMCNTCSHVEQIARAVTK
jgi:hypothetical protein